MSSKLTNVSSKKARKAFLRLGCEPGAKGSGSHEFMSRKRVDEDGNVVGYDMVTLVLGKKEINRFTLEGMLKQQEGVRGRPVGRRGEIWPDGPKHMPLLMTDLLPQTSGAPPARSMAAWLEDPLGRVPPSLVESSDPVSARVGALCSR